MKPTSQDRQRIERCLEQLDDWRKSGVALKAYAEQHGHSYTQWRAWLGAEAHWHQMLDGTANATTFVQARAAQSRPPTEVAGLRITLQSQTRPLAASIDWPLQHSGAASACAAWLREVLA